MELLGSDLSHLFSDCNHKFTLKTVLMLADQIIQTMEFIHSKNYLHCGLAPRNIMMGTGHELNKLFMMDFGKAKKFTNEQGKHIEYS